MAISEGHFDSGSKSAILGVFDGQPRGIDVGAKSAAHCAVWLGGTAIIVVSSEMPEILGITNRRRYVQRQTLGRNRKYQRDKSRELCAAAQST